MSGLGLTLRSQTKTSHSRGKRLLIGALRLLPWGAALLMEGGRRTEAGRQRPAETPAARTDGRTDHEAGRAGAERRRRRRFSPSRATNEQWRARLAPSRRHRPPQASRSGGSPPARLRAGGAPSSLLHVFLDRRSGLAGLSPRLRLPGMNESMGSLPC